MILRKHKKYLNTNMNIFLRFKFKKIYITYFKFYLYDSTLCYLTFIIRIYIFHTYYLSYILVNNKRYSAS